MNIIDPEVTFNPNTMKLIHCNGCDTTFAAKKIPNACPYCGSPKGKKGVGSASEDECVSWGEEYSELMARKMEREHEKTEMADEAEVSDSVEEMNDTGYTQDNSGWSDDSDSTIWDESASQDTGSEYASDDDIYEPIGYDPDELANNMTGKKRVSRIVLKQMISDAERQVKEAKWAAQRAGLPTTAFQNIMPDVKNQSGKLEGYTPDYARLMIQCVVDNTIQQELRHPRKGRAYTVSDINDLLKEMDIDESYWESYYSVAGVSY